MVLPLYSSLEKMDYSLIEAAKDLGCPPTSAFWKITFPLSVPGVIAGCLLVFIPAVGEFVIPDLLGGSSTLMIGKTLWNEFFANRDWPVSSAVAVILLLLLTVPIMPEVITGLSLLLLFVAVGLDRGFLTVTLAHITLTMCFVAVVVQSRLVSFDRSLEEAAMDLGATPVKTFFQITLPVILPAIVSGWMLAFTLSLDDLVIASFTSGPGATTLPMKIYSQVRLGVTPEINAACTILIAVVAVGVIIASIANKRREVQRQLDEQVAQRG